MQIKRLRTKTAGKMLFIRVYFLRGIYFVYCILRIAVVYIKRIRFEGEQSKIKRPFAQTFLGKSACRIAVAFDIELAHNLSDYVVARPLLCSTVVTLDTFELCSMYASVILSLRKLSRFTSSRH